MKYKLMGDNKSCICLIQLVSSFDEDLPGIEYNFIKSVLPDKSFAFAALKIENPNLELSPWQASAVFGNNNFGDRAATTLSYITKKMIPELNTLMNVSNGSVKYILGGYSLAGLFALWAGYQTNIFYGVTAVSPSVWFPMWDKYISEHNILANKVYLSLGDREHKTRNQVMSKVSERIMMQYDMLAAQLGGDNCTFEWNQGNHFKEPEIRMARGYSWMLKTII